MCVYLLCLTRPYKHARHYVGWSKDLEARLAHHRAGTGANLLRVAKKAGIDFGVVCVWPEETRTFERKLKNTHRVARYCPVCSGKSVREYRPKGDTITKPPSAVATHHPSF